MISEAETVAAQATQKCEGDESAISKEIKLYFDDKHGPTWHCVVGGNFQGVCITRSKNFSFLL